MILTGKIGDKYIVVKNGDLYDLQVLTENGYKTVFSDPEWDTVAYKAMKLAGGA